MKAHRLFMIAVVVCAASLARADITDAQFYPDSDGNIVVNYVNWSWDQASTTCSLWADETQHDTPGHVFANFITNEAGDPFAWIYKDVTNDTDFVWTDYHINVWLNRPFTIVSASEPTGWLAPVITDPVQQGAIWYGSVDYYSGGPAYDVQIGSEATFDLRLWWQSGTANFSIEQIPTPEPGSLGLLALGALVLLRRR